MSDLQFLADESCDFIVIRTLRGKGYDVLAVSELENAFVVVQPGQVRFSRKE